MHPDIPYLAHSHLDEGSASDSEEEVEEVEDQENPVDESEVDSDGSEDVVALDDLEDGHVDEDAVPEQKVEIDNTVALRRIREAIRLDPSLSWTETLVISYPQVIEADVDDDLNRELAFYKQALHAANTARTLAASHSLPFTRPSDYFAEMVKSDAHMERLRSRLLDERAGIKKSEEKRREREGKKFGKQVQMEKLKERERSKKDMEERLKGLKRKRKGALENAEADGAGGDAFDIAVEDAIADRPAKHAKGPGGKKITRNARDQKFGFGSQGRRSKQNTKASTDNFDSAPGKRGHGSKAGRGGAGGSKRPGKSKRVASRSRK
ncbi:eukaryotic rRNA processing [Suillus fuscotomentosus]|uniref:Eukaryotic rRNA processing n=1 Tax=Suillus fuscotomentosus TaxID=1912939 RepID=A0AAD4E7I5_9AGAM|nr:eukaryotic rRNA processing [Suillus fuscotomentosus]KAG1901165.1 eukaryotic rRNA processing [Suillus fuscotomentosus]